MYFLPVQEISKGCRQKVTEDLKRLATITGAEVFAVEAGGLFTLTRSSLVTVTSSPNDLNFVSDSYCIRDI